MQKAIALAHSPSVQKTVAAPLGQSSSVCPPLPPHPSAASAATFALEARSVVLRRDRMDAGVERGDMRSRGARVRSYERMYAERSFALATAVAVAVVDARELVATSSDVSIDGGREEK